MFCAKVSIDIFGKQSKRQGWLTGGWYVYNRSLMLNKVRYFLSFGLLLFGGSLLVWALLPARRQVDEQTIRPDTMRMKLNGQDVESAVMDARQVRLEWRSSMRIGDDEVIRLEFETIENASSPEQQTGFTDAYNSYNIMAEARFEVAGVRVKPANPTRESMPAGQPVRFMWEVSTERAGDFKGNVWLSLRFLPLDGSPPIQEPIYVSEVGIHATSLFGLSGTLARILGGVGVGLSLLLVYKDMSGLVISWKTKNNTKYTKVTKD